MFKESLLVDACTIDIRDLRSIVWSSLSVVCPNLCTKPSLNDTRVEPKRGEERVWERSLSSHNEWLARKNLSPSLMPNISYI